MRPPEAKSGNPLSNESVLQGLPTDVVELFAGWGPATPRELQALVFVAQQHGLISKRYEFVFPDDDELVPLSSDLSQDVHKMERQGIMREIGDMLGRLSMPEDFRGLLLDKADVEIVSMSEKVKPLMNLTDNELRKFTKFIACRALLSDEGYPHEEIKERTQKRLLLSAEEQTKFIKISELLASNQP